VRQLPEVKGLPFFPPKVRAQLLELLAGEEQAVVPHDRGSHDEVGRRPGAKATIAGLVDKGSDQQEGGPGRLYAAERVLPG